MKIKTGKIIGGIISAAWLAIVFTYIVIMVDTSGEFVIVEGWEL